MPARSASGPTDSPGVTIREMDALTGSRCLPTGEMVFADCRLPAACRLGPEHRGFAVAMKMLDWNRVTIPARCVGVAQAWMKQQHGEAAQ